MLALTAYYLTRPAVPPIPPRNHLIARRPNRRPVVPDQVTGVQIAVVTPEVGQPATEYTLQIGPNGYGAQPIASLFDRTTFDAEHLFGNLRLRRLIGNYGVLWSEEFRQSINASGIKLGGATYFNVTFEQNQDGSFVVGFGQAVGSAPNETITVDPGDLADDTHDLGMIVKNVKSFLRVAGFTDLTTPAPNGVYAGLTAIEAVAMWTFRY